MGAMGTTTSADVVFLDPDTGIECKSVRPHYLKGPKYAFWDEIKPFAERGQSVVVYHHLNRSCSSEIQVARLRALFRERMPKGFYTRALIYKRGTRRAYFVAAAPEHREILNRRLSEFLASPWNQHFEGGDLV
jgi:hypothetical protein